MRIAIGIPCFAGVDYRVLEDYMRFAYYLGRRYPEHEFYLAIRGKIEQYRARNEIVQEAMAVDADYLLMMDDDHIIDIDGIVGRPSAKYEFLRKLLAHDVDIVGALYWQRGADCNPVVMSAVTDTGYRLMTHAELQNGLQPVDVAGGGCILIKMQVFKALPRPWFKAENIEGYSTDIQICRMAKAHGFGVYLDSSVEIGHQQQEKRIVTSQTRLDILRERQAVIENNHKEQQP